MRNGPQCSTTWLIRSAAALAVAQAPAAASNLLEIPTYVDESSHHSGVRRTGRCACTGPAVGNGASEKGLGQSGAHAGAARPGPDGQCGIIDCRNHALQHLRDAHQDQLGRQRVPAAGRELGGLS
ncbi:hypothetical protein SDC9_188658 [bioreactor metagenome]|uniref:Uncharacterized protein n=1 Tax=bioreactor metagenome TaxID=1076179 RepID=A0A645HRA9_9ZZZZ